MRTASRIRSYRRLWIPDLAVLLLLGVVALILFSNACLELRIQDALYRGWGQGTDLHKAWPAGEMPPWNWVREYGPWPAIATGIASFLALIGSAWKRSLARYRIHCLFLVLSLLLGPGLVVNVIAKPWFGRPRPRQIERYGGTLAYQPPFARSTAPGCRSFPSGHASTGFYFVAFYFLFRTRRGARKWCGLACGVVLGAFIGYARMLAGGHFLSDVVWSFLAVAAVELLLYYFVLNVPASEEQSSAPTPGSCPPARARAGA